MHPEELWDNLRKAFNWPPYHLIKNYKGQQRLWVEIGAENIYKMREAIWDLASQGTIVEGDVNETVRTGYYFRKGGNSLTLNYYDNDTGMITLLNPSPYPSSPERKLLEDMGWTVWKGEKFPDAFFLNRIPASSIGMREGSPPTTLGQTYWAQLPIATLFINWIGSKPLSSRK